MGSDIATKRAAFEHLKDQLAPIEAELRELRRARKGYQHMTPLERQKLRERILRQEGADASYGRRGIGRLRWDALIVMLFGGAFVVLGAFGSGDGAVLPLLLIVAGIVVIFLGLGQASKQELLIRGQKTTVQAWLDARIAHLEPIDRDLRDRMSALNQEIEELVKRV